MRVRVAKTPRRAQVRAHLDVVDLFVGDRLHQSADRANGQATHGTPGVPQRFADLEGGAIARPLRLSTSPARAHLAYCRALVHNPVRVTAAGSAAPHKMTARSEL